MSSRAGILGAIVGDALGVPAEFRSRSEMRDNPMTDMVGYGTYNQPPGTWSDDSSLLLCLLSSLIDGYDLSDIARKFVDWYFGNLWQPHGVVFDIGISTREVICRLQEGENPQYSGNIEEQSNGNGSLMRILPLLYFLLSVDDHLDRYKFVYEVSGITHAHVRSKLCCFFYLEMARLILLGKNKFQAFEGAKIVFNEALLSLKIAEVEKANFNRLLNPDFANFSDKDIWGSGYVLHCLEASIWCLLNTTSYKEAVLKAVNLGDDTDTTATVTGGIAGILYGEESIPVSWLKQIARLDDITTEIQRFDRRYSL